MESTCEYSIIRRSSSVMSRQVGTSTGHNFHELLWAMAFELEDPILFVKGAQLQDVPYENVRCKGHCTTFEKDRENTTGATSLATTTCMPGNAVCPFQIPASSADELL